MSKPYDTLLKRLFDDYASDWAAYLAGRIGAPVGPATPIGTDLSANLQADRLFRVDSEPPYALHVELQSSSLLGMPERMLGYNVQARHVSGLPVESVLMLLRPSAVASDQSGLLELPGAGGSRCLWFRYNVIRVWEVPVETFLNSGLGLTPFSIVTNEAATDLEAALARLSDRLSQPDVPPGVKDALLGRSFVLGGLRYEIPRLTEAFGGIDMFLEESVSLQWLLQRGEAKGIAIGEAIGKANGSRHSILTLGPKRLGPIPAEVEAALRAELDPDRLARINDRILDAADWADLLATA